MSDATTDIRERIIAALRTVKDPEIPVNLYDLGLIYGLDVAADGVVNIRMTLTSPNCPVAELLPEQVKRAAESAEGVTVVEVEMVWEPGWTGEMMSEDAKMALEMMGIEWADPHGSVARTSLTFGKSDVKKKGPRD